MNKMMMLAVVASAFMGAKMSEAEGTNAVRPASDFPVPQHGKLSMNVPATWKHDVRQPPGNIPPTITLTPTQGDDFKTLITVLWSPKKDATFNKSEAVKHIIDNDLQEMLPGAVEKRREI